MVINRGYVGNHKTSGNIETIEMTVPIKSIIKCPNCGFLNESKGKYDENVDDLITCSECGYTTSKWNYEYVSAEGSGEDE